MKRRTIEAQTLSVPTAGKLLGMSRGAAYKYAREGSIPTLKIGRRILILREPFMKMLSDPGRRPAA